ncbi:hypothetical protein SLS60_007028 [Paraconiothyrium brasiliense]|uniref:Rhodopsin domain-containing protein n=1 Tax=Paraconiothyrium brasiliense TaxID=300254 RepID=A0ABR3R890_9PLEO
MFRSQDGHLAIAPRHALRSEQLVFASEVVFATSIALVKISILLGYRELFYVLVWVKRFIWLMIAACVVIFASNTAGLMTMCAPFEANYDPDIKGVCRVSRSLGASLATVINVVVDVILVVIPVCVVRTLKINTTKKFGMSLMFGLGLLLEAWDVEIVDRSMCKYED